MFDTKITNTFNAVDEAGSQYVVIEYTTIANILPQGSKVPISTSPIEPVYRLSDRRRVNKLSETEFQIDGSDQKLLKQS